MRIHLVGVGGSGVSALARLFLARGDLVSGCDLYASEVTAQLQSEGLHFSLGHHPAHAQGQQVVIFSGAAKGAREELQAAHEQGAEVLSRAQMLARLMTESDSVAVAGSHGKTTVTFMTGHVLERAGWDPTVLVGDGSSSRVGASRWLVAEADESDGSLDLHRPRHAIVTNVEFDHPDHFANLGQLETIFGQFLGRLPAAGVALVCADDPIASRLSSSGRLVTYGFAAAADWRCVPEGRGGPEVLNQGRAPLPLRLAVPGRHNLQNATAALAMACELGVEGAVAAAALASFPGAKRRMELIGSWRGARVYDDYAHHPTEVAAVIEAARSLGGERVVLVFQPHRYSRFAVFAGQFGAALGGADLALVTEIYGAGEPNPDGVSARAMAAGAGLDFAPDSAAARRWMGVHVRARDVVILMGAGDIQRLGNELAQQG